MTGYHVNFGRWDDWKYPRPSAWDKDYHRKPHVEACNEAIEQYRDGLLTLAELIDHLSFEYAVAYTKGEDDPRYPVPAVADTTTVLILTCLDPKRRDLAWDGVWREDLPSVVYQIPIPRVTD